MDAIQIQNHAAPEDQPPQAPDVERRFQLERAQWMGIPLILLIPILALFGVFGNRSKEASALAEGLAVRVEYPSVVRYGNQEALHISVRNPSARPIPSIVVGLDRSYVERYTQVAITPDATEVTDQEYRILMRSLLPGDERVVRVEFEPNEIWRQAGSIRVLTPGRAPVEIPVSTFVVP